MTIVYSSLKQQHEEIRLLDIEPATKLSDPLCGTIRHAKLHEATFFALSYVWGQEVRDRSDITVRYKKSTLRSIGSKLKGKLETPTHTHSLGNSLATALRYLRKKYGKFTIWTDALCINQKDADEKSWQVLLMTSIYSKATEVHAWLGPQMDGDIDTAFSLADTVWALAEKVTQTRHLITEEDWLEACITIASPHPPADQAQRRWTDFAAQLRHATLSDHSVVQRLAAVKSLSQLEYFQRMWILQETGRARVLTFHYGLQHTSHRRLLLTLSLVNSLRDISDNSQFAEQLHGFDTRFLGCLAARTTCAQKRTLQDVLATAYFGPPPLHQASNLRDLVYARLGLADSPLGIEVNYNLNVAEVYTAASRFLLLQGFMDLLLSFKPYRFQQWSSSDTLPSWAYDWSKKGSNVFSSYNAANSTSQQVSIASYPDANVKQMLVMTGVDIGHVQSITKRFSTVVTASGLHNGTIALGNLQAVSEPLTVERKHLLSRNIYEGYQNIGIQAKVADIESLFGYRSLPFASFWCWWIHWIAALLKLIEDSVSQHSGSGISSNDIAELLFREAPRTLRNTVNLREFSAREVLLSLVSFSRWSRLLLDAGPEHTGSTDQAAVQIANTLFRSAWGMRPAVLDTGRLGYVPEDTKVEDKVVIFHGVKAPLVIRKATENTYKIIGPAHMCGIMQGELFEAEIRDNSYRIV